MGARVIEPGKVDEKAVTGAKGQVPELLPGQGWETIKVQPQSDKPIAFKYRDPARGELYAFAIFIGATLSKANPPAR